MEDEYPWMWLMPLSSTLELVYQDLMAGEQLNLFATNVDRDC